MPILAPEGGVDPAEIELAAALVSQWRTLAGRDLCLDRIEIVPDLTVGDGHPAGGVTSFGASPYIAISAGNVREEVVFHELCHALDFTDGISETFADLFPPDGVDVPDDRSDESARREHFANRCEVGPVGAVAAVVEASCGDPTVEFVEEYVYGADVERVRIAPTARSAAGPVLTTIDGTIELVDRGKAIRWLDQPAWFRLLDETLEPVGEPFGTHATATGTAHVGDGVIFLNPYTPAPPRLLSPSGTTEVALPAGDWGVAWGQDRWWAGLPGDRVLYAFGPDGLLEEEVDAGGILEAVLDLDGPVAFVDDERGDGRLTWLETGHTATTARGIEPQLAVSGLWVGVYSYDIPYDRGILPRQGAGGVWIDAVGGITYVTSPCDEGSLTGEVQGLNPGVDYGQDESNLFFYTTTYAIE